MDKFLLAWLIGMGLSVAHDTYGYKVGTGIGYKDPNASALPPKPGKLLIASGIFVGLAILAEAPSMRTTATLLAWGYNVAIALRWSSEYTTNKTSGFKPSGTPFWDPPIAPNTVLFPTGAGPEPTVKPFPGSAFPTTPGNPSGGPAAAA